MKKIIKTSQAPAPIGSYSQAVLAGNTLYISGQIPINIETKEVISGEIGLATIQVMENLEAILTHAEFSFADVVKTTIFLKNMNDIVKVNEIYDNYFTDNYPARETIEVSRLPKNVNVEISMIAVKF
jgi:2-iminobutanoate/2-iminopropanoate deaminase